MSTFIKMLSLLLIFLGTFSLCKTQNLTAVYLNAILPQNSALTMHGVWYDGDDSIYLFGGMIYEGVFSKEILKYSIESDQIEIFGELPQLFANGKVETDSSGNVFILGGIDNIHRRNTIYKFDPVANKTEIVAFYESDGNFNPVFSQRSNSNTLLLLGDGQDAYTMKTFDMESHTFNNSVAQIPDFFTLSVGVRFNDSKAYIFTGVLAIGKVWELDLETLEFRQIVGAYVPTSMDSGRNGFSDGEAIYIVSGFRDIPFPGFPEEGYPNNGILKFDPATETTNFIPVDNWPTEGTIAYFHIAPQCAYVPKTTRMYCFGGDLGPYLNTIFYVDLKPSSETTQPPIESTTELSLSFCLGLPNGLYPHPNDCSSFLSCWDEDLYQLFCPEGTFYSPSTQNCGDVNFCQMKQ